MEKAVDKIDHINCFDIAKLTGLYAFGGFGGGFDIIDVIFNPIATSTTTKENSASIY